MDTTPASSLRRGIALGASLTAATLLAACSSAGSASGEAQEPAAMASGAADEEGPAMDEQNTAADRPVEQQLTAYRASFNERADDDTKALFQRYGVDAQRPVTERALNVGDKAPDFTLPNAVGEAVTLNELLRDGPVVITWYRGGWCPYCNIHLKGFQDLLPQFTAVGAQLVAISPETPDNSLDTKQKSDLAFHVLSDDGNAVARRFNIAYQLGAPLRSRFGEMLQEYNGDASGELPLAATYVVDTDGTITYAYLNEDYRERAEPSDVLAAVRKLR